MHRCNEVFFIWRSGIGSLNSSIRNRFNSRSISSTSKKAAFSRVPVRVYEPQQLQMKKPVAKYDTIIDDRSQKLTNSSSVFNLTMGEVMMSKSRKRIAIEGIRLVEEALKAKLKLEKLFILKGLKDLSPGLNHFLEVEQHQNIAPEIHTVSAKLMQTWSSVTTPPGIIGIFKKPKTGDVIAISEKTENNVPLTVICDNIREPGNLGSILRSAAGAGCKEMLLTKGCVDAWNMKVLRGACGAHFYIPILPEIPTDAVQSSILRSVTQEGNNKEQRSITPKVALFVADSKVEDRRLELPLFSHSDVDYTSFQHVFLVIGGETEGISSEIVQLVKGFSESNAAVFSARIRISLANNIDSLNASNAFGIIAFEMSRQLRNMK